MLENNTPDFDIARHLAIILKRKYIALSVALIVISVFTWGSFFLPRIYEASSTVLVEGSSVIDPLIKGVGVTENPEELLGNLKSGLTSRNMVEKVVKQLSLDTKAGGTAGYDDLIENIRSTLKLTTVVGARGGTELFTVSYMGNNPEVVKDVVNTLVKEYIEEKMQYRMTDTSAAYDFIEKQLVEYKNRLEESDKATREFRERNPRMVPQDEGAVMARLEGFQTSLIDAEIKQKELTMKRNNLQKQLSGEKELTVAFVTREGSPQARLNYLNNQLMLLTTKYTDNYPEVIKVKSELEELKKQIAEAKDSHTESAGSETSAMNPIYQQLKEEMVKTDSEIESLRARSAELVRQQQEAQGILGRMPKEQEEWSKLQRDRNVYQKIYDDLLQKLENARVSKDLGLSEKGESPLKVVDPALLPSTPVKPNRVQIILFGIFCGLASGLGAAYGLEYFDHSFKDEASLKEKLKVQVLAVIPRIVTEADRLAARQFEKKIFTAAGLYLFIITLVLAREFLDRYLGIRIINF